MTQGSKSASNGDLVAFLSGVDATTPPKRASSFGALERWLANNGIEVTP